MLTKESALRKDQTTAHGAELQHRHFAFIAATIKQMHTADRTIAAKHFADACAGTNPRFDRARFLSACGANGELK